MAEELWLQQCARLQAFAFSGNGIPFGPQPVLVAIAVATVVLLCAFIFSKRCRGNESEKKQKVRTVSPGDVPPVFPNGWIPVLESSDLKKGEVKAVSVIGQDLVAFRTEDGTARVFHAYCPHLGAHLGVMGRVVDDCIECPFHGWRFQADTGACTHVPYAEKVPTFGKAKTWTCKELLGYVFIWYHADGEEPSYDIPTDALEEGMERETSCASSTGVRGHIQDIAENGADLAHFNQIHWANGLVNGIEYRKNQGESWMGRIFKHHWSPVWSYENHVGTVTLNSSISVLGWKPDFLRHHTVARTIGPALTIIHIRGSATNYMVVQAVMPEGPFNIKVVHRVHFQPRMSWFLKQLYVIGLRNMVVAPRRCRSLAAADSVA
ncbi:cholesterol 7-desaturase nvd-like isoform X2 [Amblyomma americanum]